MPTTPGSIAIEASCAGVARTLIPLTACCILASTVPPIASMLGSIASCCRRRPSATERRSDSEIRFPGARLRTTATGSPAIFNTTVSGSVPRIELRTGCSSGEASSKR